MPSNVPSRKPAREAYAALLDTAFGSDWDVFNYKTNKFNGKAKNVVVTTAGSARVEMGADEEGIDPNSVFRLRVFVFVLYQVQPVVSTSSPTAGANKVLLVPDTTNFVNGATVRIEDGTNSENAVINAVPVANTSIQVAALVNAYTTPKVYAWTPQNSDDELDAAEKKITDVNRDNRKNALWDKLEMIGESDPDSIVDEGGQTFRREIFMIRMENYS